MSSKSGLFPKEKGLGTRTAIIVPSTKDVNKPISHGELNKRVDVTRKFLNKEFGGSTTVKGVGSYTSSKGKLVKEDVVIVENFSADDDYRKKDKEVEKFVEEKAAEWGQESVGFEYESPKRPNTRLVFVKPLKKKLREMS